MMNDGKALSVFKAKITKRKVYVVVSLLLVFVLGIFLGIKIGGDTKDTDTNLSVELREKGYTYISPLLDSEPRKMSTPKDLLSLEGGINDLIVNIKSDYDKYHASHISVYYKEFSSGAWIGVGENEKFTPASLIKIPLMMAYYKIAELDPSFLNTQIKYERVEDNLYQNIDPPPEFLENGKSYTIEELINNMIIYSDNQAFNVLLNYLKLQNQQKIYSDLGLRYPSDLDSADFMSVKDYSGFFRILYNASYLNKEMSSKALQLLTKVKYNKGLVAGLPKNIFVAHKFGERGYPDNNIKQLHDCGIVYYPKNPYLICIMTRGESFTNLENVIQKLSKYVYQTVSQ